MRRKQILREGGSGRFRMGVMVRVKGALIGRGWGKREEESNLL